MIQNIVLTSTFILGSFIYLKWLYNRTDGLFKKGDDLFDKSITLRGWAGGLLILIVGICFLIRGILKYL